MQEKNVQENKNDSGKNISVLTSVIIAVVLICGSLIYAKSAGSGSYPLSQEKASEKIINFINTQLLQAPRTATLVEIKKESNLYKYKFSIDGQEFEAYSSLDGKLFFPEVFPVQ